MTAAPLLRLENIVKAFPGVRALDGVSFDLRPSEVHALCGENGAGKSTLMKILGGHYRPDSGRMSFGDEEVHFHRPSDARRRGILLVHQEIALAPDLSVAENIFLGHLPRRLFGRIDRARLYSDAQRVLDDFGYDLDPTEIAGRLSIARQQMIEVARAAAFQSSVVVFDEPTASLTDKEARALFQVIASLKSRGVGVVYISHRMPEILELSDRITVLRDGKPRGTLKTAETDEAEVTRLMIGRALEGRIDRGQRSFGAEVMRLEGFSARGSFEDISMTIREGEIVGLYGLVGAGRSELVETIFGIRRATDGRIYWRGSHCEIHAARNAIALGIGLVPESRKEQGLVLGMGCGENLTLSHLGTVSRFGVIGRNAETRLFEQFRDRLKIAAQRSAQQVGRLSGGNQQKVVIGKWLNGKPQLLIVDEPTRGIDVGSKAELHGLLADLANGGMAILVISSEMPEIIRVSHRVLTMYRGRVTGEFEADSITEENLIAGATGLTSGESAIVN